MATYRFYRAPTLGTGASTQDYIRSKLQNYIVNDGTPTSPATQDFWDWSFRTRSARYCLAWCDSTVHTTIAADAEITVLSPELADIAAIQTWLDGLVGSLPAGLATVLEADGISTTWLTGTTTRRQLWRFIAKLHSLVQKLSGSGDADLRDLFKNGLATTVGQVPVAARNKIGNWMINQGMDTSWITGATTLRQVTEFVVANASFPPLRMLTQINFDG